MMNQPDLITKLSMLLGVLSDDTNDVGHFYNLKSDRQFVTIALNSAKNENYNLDKHNMEHCNILWNKYKVLNSQ